MEGGSFGHEECAAVYKQQNVFLWEEKKRFKMRPEGPMKSLKLADESSWVQVFWDEKEEKKRKREMGVFPTACGWLSPLITIQVNLRKQICQSG